MSSALPNPGPTGVPAGGPRPPAPRCRAGDSRPLAACDRSWAGRCCRRPRPGRGMGHHLAQAGQACGREVAGAGRLPTIRVGSVRRSARLLWVGRPGRESRASRWSRCSLPVGREASMVDSRSMKHLPTWCCGSHAHTIAGAVLPLPRPGAAASRSSPASKNMGINP